MWSVTEQNHLHYYGVMFQCFRLVHWWPPTSMPQHLCFFVSVFCIKCVVAKHCLSSSLSFFFSFFKAIFSNGYLFISPSIHPSSSTSIFFCSVRALLHHLSLGYLRSYFFLSFCSALRCCHQSALASLPALVLFVHLHSLVGPQLLAVNFSHLILILSPSFIEVFQLFLR